MINMDVPKADQAKFITSSDKSLEATWSKGLNLLKSLAPDIYRNGYYPTGNTGTFEPDRQQFHLGSTGMVRYGAVLREPTKGD